MKLLLVEDSASLRKSLTIGLQNLGFTVDETEDGSEGLTMSLSNDYDVIILDIMLPSIDGLTLLKALRSNNNGTRVLLLSARSQPEDRVKGLLSGADDYLTKPFSFDELHARLMTLLRRGTLRTGVDNIELRGFSLDMQLKTLKAGKKLIDLTPNEYKIVECLFTNQNTIVTSEKLSEHIAGHYDAISKNSIEAHLSSARKKAKVSGLELPIQTKRGFGYMVVK
ncbi:MAG: DNA-binding response regulator [Alteromonadaceae bacterium]|jgi:DNA-binding response OmpR family regulator|uniref:Response regulator mprA n=1 Tax=Paraglaciecola agarilytica NO2 TaxID=1125747 RepID=A0ABQ0I8Q2_9ALTE|nr:response regulator transcription factor [Paraglaciecola agarilytica]MBN28189.1 DNA-binding response regulator [Alteromonadaceae bacterium]GAC05696.1 response regulator mprA [Paraglaciecola agarilytica NO2]|tara:strand:- start:10191 stop:10862 length:672 start_codon:yes stop_codon:yes gene_type:complete